MTLPASAPITLQQVATELGVGLPITLNASNVHTLFGVGGNPITLLQGLGKSNWVRATGATYTGTTPTNPTYAYNGTTNYLDFTDSATLFTSTNITSTQTYIFAAGTKTGSLKVGASSIITQDNLSANSVNEAVSTVTIDVSIDGSTYSYNLLNQSGGITVSNQTYILSLSSQNMSLLKVRVTATSQRFGSGMGLAIATVQCNIADIIVV